MTHAEAGGLISDTAASQAMDKCARQLASRFDAENGGFGSAPRFPRPAEINVLLCSHTRSTAGGATVESRAPEPSTCLTFRSIHPAFISTALQAVRDAEGEKFSAERRSLRH